MQRIVLLRGLNVGRANRMTMVELRAALEAVGCTRVRTYLQSGNAVVDAPSHLTPDDLATLIGGAVS